MNVFALFADEQNQVLDHPSFTALARMGDQIVEVEQAEWIPLPKGATLVSMPNTRAVGVDEDGSMGVLPDGGMAVGALLPQGYTRLMVPAYVKQKADESFPLFGYTAAGWSEEHGFVVAAECTDEPERWSPTNCDPDELEAQVDVFRKAYPDNRLFNHLAHCALDYECLTASNTFLNRWEGSVPVSFACNAGCFGCISEQPEDSGFSSPQTRMNFKPTVDEITEVMLKHLKDEESIISFGQGCEGEPSTQAPSIIEAIRRVRATTDVGFININTNAGLTDHIKGIVDAGLDMMRVSTISALDGHYNAYYKPRGYTLDNVEKSTKYAVDKGVYTSINYLIFPGVTDREEEIDAMIGFCRRTGLHRIQMRNLNIDPEAYLNLIPPAQGELYGMKQMLEILRQELPDVIIGSYSHVPPLGNQRKRR
jgi:pyruvate-formate lyase-activating enzyme